LRIRQQIAECGAATAASPAQNMQIGRGGFCDEGVTLIEYVVDLSSDLPLKGRLCTLTVLADAVQQRQMPQSGPHLGQSEHTDASL
jgi:hypothetical protein